ncbi:hypothetical protein IMSAG049_00655 [Clostridiales bacterium]|nr:hypothetical protein IMSAG049_00655 [Clostridiales bacterium]
MARRRKNNGVKHKKSGNRRPAEAYNDEIIKVRPKAKRKGSPINVLTVILFAVILGYLVKYAIDFASDDMTVEIETVNYGTIDIPNSFRGLIVRDEYVVKASRSGEPIFNFGEGDKVKKNAVVCTVRESETAQNAESRLQMLDESIIETQKKQN